MDTNRLTRDGTARPVTQEDQILRGERGQENIHSLPCSADHKQDWQPYPVDPYYSCCKCDHEYIHKRNMRENKNRKERYLESGGKITTKKLSYNPTP